MKKSLFSAVALIAFTSISMANTIEEKEITIEGDSKTVVETDCCVIYDLAYDLAISEGASPSTADAAANIAYQNCEKSKKSLSMN